ncbi:type II toxin-antitoxin system VapC family toxin [Kribbia dieselivorans]|uniref:type II toxin-antitoxin system VapC family toxin n=1 Tax=Kribbia dieselivorans TaxID=331526 RepID=UPI00083812D3|nr:type II toxin-antitoxin system VapC family toxin [Kribbia dieselivorans]
MIVIDASAMIEALVGRDADATLLAALAGEIAAPHLLDVEVLSVLRGLTLARKLDPNHADSARALYFELSIQRFSTAPLAERIWTLRHQFTSYDATYLALSEATGAPLHTCDAKLLTHGHDADVRWHGRTS